MSSFGFSDLLEDADGYLIARAVRSGQTIVEAVTHRYHDGGGLRRFNDYFQQRWGTAENCKFAAHSALTGVDATLGLARTQLIAFKGVNPPEVLQNQPGGYDKLSDFEQGFVDAILARAGAENRMVASLRANHDNYLRQSTERSIPR